MLRNNMSRKTNTKNQFVKTLKAIRDFSIKYKGSIFIILATIIFGCLILTKFLSTKTYVINIIQQALSKATTVTISMIGFSISTYIFLNNTLQRKSAENITEVETIDEFLRQKRRSLCSLVIWSACLVIIEIILLCGAQIPDDGPVEFSSEWLTICLMFACIVLSIVSIIRLTSFDFSIINYENGLVETAKKQLCIINKSNAQTTSMEKSKFLMLVNNVETVLERIAENHQNALKHSADDSLVSMALYSKVENSDVTSGQKAVRRELAKKYRKLIEFRNYILHDDQINDDDEIEVSDEMLSTVNLVFNNVLSNEIISDISISNLVVHSVDFEKTTFKNCSLKSVEFCSKSNLKSADFRDSSLNDIRLNDSDCSNANFSNAKLINLDISIETNMVGTIFNNADLSGLKSIGTLDCTGKSINLMYCNFIRANMINLDIQNTMFDHGDMSYAQLFNSKIGYSSHRKNNTSFKFVNLKSVVLTNSKVYKCDFTNANLSEATLANSDIYYTNWQECRFLNATFTESKIRQSTFDKSYCGNISMKGTNVVLTSFNHATLNSADFSAAHLDRVSFDDAVCRDALFVGASITDSSFERCILANCRFVSAGNNAISNCKFNHSNLSNSSISNIEFIDCNFIGCDLSNSRLINVKFTNCKGMETVRFSDAWLDQVEIHEYANTPDLRSAVRYCRKVDVIENDKILN